MTIIELLILEDFKFKFNQLSSNIFERYVYRHIGHSVKSFNENVMCHHRGKIMTKK